ncbi:MAG: ABC transporter ATP-binding protein [Candidatus Paracaedibacteraceae bacterium]|nr:ABC transporter ATP-binding protein [Candidatus Paracaedibacteraceae bacterium]
MPQLTTIDIRFHAYGTIPALETCQFSINEKDLIAIIGPNGGGKSTLIKIIAGLFPPSVGTINHPKLRPLDIAYLAQRTEIDRTFPIRVEDVIAMGLWPKTRGGRGLCAADHQRIQEILAKVGLAGYEKRSISQLSGGQLQRMFFGRVMAQDAKLILLDEPFTGIDQPTVSHLLNLIREWNANGKTVVAVLHDIPIVRQVFPLTALVARSLIAYGPTSDVLNLETLTKATFDV